jgi:hypothetical protein
MPIHACHVVRGASSFAGRYPKSGGGSGLAQAVPAAHVPGYIGATGTAITPCGPLRIVD